MEKIKSLVHNKKFVMFIFFALVCTSAIFAEDSDTFGLNSKVQILVNLLSSPWVKGIACIALIVECIGLVTAGRQEPGMFKKFIPWIAGTIIFMAAGTITNKFLSVDNSTFSEVMK
ncbi:MAG: TrbC/VirB2 family protein [Treponema sp.]|nr:TrbC/VirB2 family protein [Treponema sp.]MDD6653602.1 TrbC/VirB2 family protein [Treponema sp.]